MVGGYIGYLDTASCDKVFTIKSLKWVLCVDVA